MISRVPGEAIAHFQLGLLYRQANRLADAQKQFETAADLDPQLAAARFQLYNLSRPTGNIAQTARYLADFERLRELQKTWVIPEDAEWCDYAEVYDPPAARAQAAVLAVSQHTDTRLEGSADGLMLIDSAGKGQTDLLV